MQIIGQVYIYLMICHKRMCVLFSVALSLGSKYSCDLSTQLVCAGASRTDCQGVDTAKARVGTQWRAFGKGVDASSKKQLEG